MNQLSKKILENQGYRFVGKHSAIKICHYTKNSINGKSSCYKNTFYGIKSHQCAQMTPNLVCSNLCDFCWRSMDFCNDVKMNEQIDDPSSIVDGVIEEQKKLLNGFGGGKQIDMEKYLESKNIKHFAISLTGEPTMYKPLGKLITTLRERNITSFLVTNGQFPEALVNLDRNDELPTQLYVSLDAPNKEIYKEVDKPMLKDYWDRFNRTMELVFSFRNKTRTVLRITAVKGLNMCDEDGYASLIKKANPMFLEIKGYSWVGDSRNRLTSENVPSFEDVKDFAKNIADLLQWKVIEEHEESRAILLMEEDNRNRLLR